VRSDALLCGRKGRKGKAKKAREVLRCGGSRGQACLTRLQCGAPSAPAPLCPIAALPHSEEGGGGREAGDAAQEVLLPGWRKARRRHAKHRRQQHAARHARQRPGRRRGRLGGSLIAAAIFAATACAAAAAADGADGVAARYVEGHGATHARADENEGLARVLRRDVARERCAVRRQVPRLADEATHARALAVPRKVDRVHNVARCREELF